MVIHYWGEKMNKRVEKEDDEGKRIGGGGVTVVGAYIVAMKENSVSQRKMNLPHLQLGRFGQFD